MTIKKSGKVLSSNLLWQLSAAVWLKFNCFSLKRKCQEMWEVQALDLLIAALFCTEQPCKLHDERFVKSQSIGARQRVRTFEFSDRREQGTGSPQSIYQQGEMCSLTKAVKPLLIDLPGLLATLYTHIPWPVWTRTEAQANAPKHSAAIEIYGSLLTARM